MLECNWYSIGHIIKNWVIRYFSSFVIENIEFFIFDIKMQGFSYKLLLLITIVAFINDSK